MIKSSNLETSTSYIAAEELMKTVNIAMTLEKPLLVKGEPGTGKTMLAQAVADALGKKLLIWNIKSTTKAQDGLYTYDVVQRLYDSQFGSNVDDVHQYIKYGKIGEAFLSEDQVVLLIDEIASGTNPAEGLALTKSITDYLKQQPFISLITTHFETVTEDPDVVNMQVTGLANADFDRLDKELRYANRRERINIIQKYMDYRLTRVDNNREIPKDALNIAKMLGIDAKIIEKAKQYLN